MIDNNDAVHISAVIGILAATVTWLAGHALLTRKRMKDELAIASRDIAYLMAVEQAHCEKHRELNHATFKLRIRKEVAAQGLTWSGRFCPQQVHATRSSRTVSTTVNARLIILTKQIFEVIVNAISYLAKNLPKWFDVVLVTVEKGVTKSLLARLASTRNT